MSWTLSFFFLVFGLCFLNAVLVGGEEENDVTIFPKQMTLKAAVLTNTVPLAYHVQDTELDDNGTEIIPFSNYQGFQPDLLRHLQFIAKDLDNVSLAFDLQEAPAFSYTAQFEYVANDCNTTQNPLPLEECQEYDLIVGDYYGYPARSIRTTLTPPFLTTAAATVQYVHRQARQVTTLEEARVLQEPVCLLKESHYDDQVVERFPGISVAWCFDHVQCLQLLKTEQCALFVEDELQLRFLAVQDADLQVTRERFDEQYIVWPLRHNLDPIYQQLLIRWIYQAKVSGILKQLYDQYFSINFCPIGKAGIDCDLPCSPSNGMADRNGKCVCESIKWTGDDCSIEVQEDTNMLSRGMKIVCYLMIGINFAMVLACSLWMWIHRCTAQVQVAQPLFLGFVLLGCLVSTSTIFALAVQDEEDGPVRACMAIPWLYSVGFSITFGTLFGKIRRVYLLFRAAAHMQHLAVTAKETLIIIAAVLAVDIAVLITWTLVDPLRWEREVLVQDIYGSPLDSEGYCTSDHWIAFATVIAGLHFLLMSVACYLCYVARNIPTAFSESKYLAIAMFSNLQIFVLGIPVLIIIGTESDASIFVRSAIIWINDFVVVALIFGNLVYHVSRGDTAASDEHNRAAFIRNAMNAYIAHEQQSSKRHSRTGSSGGQEDGTAQTHLYSTYDGAHLASPPPSPQLERPAPSAQFEFTNHPQLPRTNINTGQGPKIIVSETEERIHVDTGDGKKIVVPISRVNIDCGPRSEETSEGLGPLNQLVSKTEKKNTLSK